MSFPASGQIIVAELPKLQAHPPSIPRSLQGSSGMLKMKSAGHSPWASSQRPLPSRGPWLCWPAHWEEGRAPWGHQGGPSPLGATLSPSLGALKVLQTALTSFTPSSPQISPRMEDVQDHKPQENNKNPTTTRRKFSKVLSSRVKF